MWFFFSKDRLTSSCFEKEGFEKVKIARLMYMSIESSNDSDDLSIGFHGYFEIRDLKLTSYKAFKGNYLVTILVKPVFGFAICQESVLYGLG